MQLVNHFSFNEKHESHEVVLYVDTSIIAHNFWQIQAFKHNFGPISGLEIHNTLLYTFYSP